ncbi:unnamed protein product [Lathyrus oleraceus]
MMKFGSLFLMVCVLFVLLSHTSGSPAPIGDADDGGPFCPRSFTFFGKCSESPTCFDELNAAFGPSGKVHQCTCKPLLENRRICTCLTICKL